MLTVPVTVATGERNFSKLNLMKTYLRSTMVKYHLCDLAIISIEKEISRLLNYDKLINDLSKKLERFVYSSEGRINQIGNHSQHELLYFMRYFYRDNILLK